MAGALSAEPPRVQVAGLLLGAAGTALAVAGVSDIGDAALLPVLAVAMLLGAMFVWLDFGFAGGLRALLSERDGHTLGAAFIVPAVAALVVLPVSMLVEGYGRFVAPIGLPLLVGAAIFGVGMQITNGCGSGRPGLPPDSVGYVSLSAATLLALPAIVVAPLAARLSARLPNLLLRRLFAICLFLIAARVLWRAGILP